MKGLIKLFSAAAVVGALASCSDDLSSFKAGGIDPNADLVATLVTSDGEDATRVAVLDDKTVVWNKDDMVKTYCPGKLAFNTFILDSGEGTTTGNFVDYQIQDASMKTRTDLVAITSSELVKGVHATDEEFPKLQLIAKIPWQFDQNQTNVLDEEGDPTADLYYPLAIPYWGENVSFNDDQQIQANMKPLAALVKIDIAALPVGTRAIVLTTHNEVKINGTTYYNNGSDEALSGTLTAVLEAGAKLAIDEDYKHRDTIRVNIPEIEEIQDKVIFVPLVAQHYDKLTILAVKGDDNQPYSWPAAEELKVLEDVDINVFKKYNIAETANIVCPLTDPAEISKFIATAILNDGKHNLNIELTKPVNAGMLYIANNLQDLGLVDKDGVKITFDEPTKGNLTIMEAAANVHPSTPIMTIDGFIPVSGDDLKSNEEERKVILNFYGTKEENTHTIILPTSVVTVDGLDAQKATFTITGASNDNVSGYEDRTNWQTPRNYKDAGIILKGRLGYVNISENHINREGTETHGGAAVYAVGDGVQDEIIRINFLGTMACPLRITDMLVSTIDYKVLDRGEFAYIYTTGNSAINFVTEANNPYRGEKINLCASWTGKMLSQYAYAAGYNQSQIFTAAQLQGMMDNNYQNRESADKGLYYEMNNIVRSVWLGDDEFPWVGAYIETTKKFWFNGKNCNLRNMKLTIEDPTWHPECCCDEFVRPLLDGIGLIRVIQTTDATTATLRVFDSAYPTDFDKCTVQPTGAVIVENVDLFDVLLEATVTNTDNIGAITGRITAANGGVVLQQNEVSDVRITAKHDNIGGAFGKVENGLDLLIKDLQVKESSSNPGISFVESQGQNIGGAIGFIDNEKRVHAELVKVKAEYVISKNYNVGGQVGYVDTKTLEYGDGTTIANGTIGSNEVRMTQQVYTVGSNVGGLIGLANFEDNNGWIRGTVTCPVIRADQNGRRDANYKVRSGCNVGGLAGAVTIMKAVDKTKITAIEGSVTAKTLPTVVDYVKNTILDDQETAGIFAKMQHAGGFVGFYEANKLQGATAGMANANVVNVATLEAFEGFAGGLYGSIETSAETILGNKASTNNSFTVTIGSLETAYAGGGLVGYNADKSLNIRTKTGSAGTTIKATVNDYVNTVATRANIFALIAAASAENADEAAKSALKAGLGYIAGYYNNTDDAKCLGSFGTVVGFMNSKLVMNDHDLTIGDSPCVATLKAQGYDQNWPIKVESKKNIIKDAKKWDLLFWGGKISAATESMEEITGQGLLFWGDEFGFVGVANQSANQGGNYVLDDQILKGSDNYNISRNYLPF